MTPLLTGVFASQISGRLAPSLTSSFDALGSVTVPSGGLSSITFQGIPQNYSHLQIRGIYRYTTGLDVLAMQFNGDTASNYSSHKIFGSGSSVGVGSTTSTNKMDLGYMMNSSYGYGAMVTDILDYANINKAKTVRAFSGTDLNGSGYMNLNSSAWYNNTSNVYPGVGSITIYPDAGAFAQNTQFSLYGVK
jgi:hypothetical protein